MSQTDGFERMPFPQLPDAPQPITPTERDSGITYAELQKHDLWIKRFLGLETDTPFVADAAALSDRENELMLSREGTYVTTRDPHMIAIQLGATVGQLEVECARKRVLDIGSGVGRLGVKLARNAKSKVTYVDEDPEMLKGIGKKDGTPVVADGRALPFEDESFEVVVAAFSTLMWAKDPVQSAQAFNEALRATTVGGTALLVPFCTKLMERHAETAKGARLSHKVWALQDHVLLKALFGLIDEGYCSVSWRSFVGKGKNTGVTLDNYSAIIDKEATIPSEVLEEHVSYARGLMA